jgi:hypothetical protein
MVARHRSGPRGFLTELSTRMRRRPLHAVVGEASTLDLLTAGRPGAVSWLRPHLAPAEPDWAQLAALAIAVAESRGTGRPPRRCVSETVAAVRAVRCATQKGHTAFSWLAQPA